MKNNKIEEKMINNIKLNKNIGLLDIITKLNIIYQTNINKKLENINNKLKAKGDKNRFNNINKKNNNANNFKVIIFYNLIIILNIFNLSKGNKFHFYYFQYSKILLKINGIGEMNILYHDYEGIKYLIKFILMELKK